MKLRYLFSIILSALFFAGCAEINTDSWDNIKLSQTYVSISEKGGSASVTITATEAWEFVADDSWPEVITRDKNDAITSSTPSWLSVDKMSGDKGETTVTFSAEASASGRELEIKVKAGDNTQYLRVRQGSLEAVTATCAEVIAGPEGKTYRVTGTCTAIANTTYGNWYLDDGTGEIYIYGTKNASGSYDWAAFNIEVGDIVTVEGSYVLYSGTTPEFVDATFISVEKALVKIVTEEKTIAKEGEQFNVEVAYKGDGLFPTVPEEYRSWVSIVEMESKPGVPSKIEPNPADTAVVKISVLPNDGGDRVGSVIFNSSTSSVPYNFTQAGAIVEATAAEINAAEDGTRQYSVTGYVTKVANTQYGNLYIKDYTGEVYVYGSYDENGDKFSTFPVKAGDIITVVGPKTSYNGSPQMKNVKIVKHISVAATTVADFLAASESKEVYYSLTGTIKNIAMNDDGTQNIYGNFDIEDNTGSVYVYGLLSGWGGPSKKFQDLKLKEGDEVTLVGVRTAHKGTPQVGSAFYVSHKAASTGGDDNTGDDNTGDDVAAGSYSVSFADVANRTVFSATQQVWVQNGVTVTNDKASSTNDVADYSNPARFYKGSALTVSKNGMKKIEFFCNDYKDTYPTDLKASITDTNATVAVDGTKVTVTFTNAANTFSIAALAGQVRVNSLTVYTE